MKIGGVKCTLDSNGTLIINTEKLEDVVVNTTYDNNGHIITPWNNYRADVKLVDIKGRIGFKKDTRLNRLFELCYNCESFNGLENLNVSEVVSMDYMFSMYISPNKKLKTLKLNNWKASSLVDMHLMFHNCSGLILLDLSNFKLKTTHSVNVNDMFKGCFSLTYIVTPGSFDSKKLASK